MRVFLVSILFISSTLSSANAVEQYGCEIQKMVNLGILMFVTRMKIQPNKISPGQS
jgi:hypothetical protein